MFGLFKKSPLTQAKNSADEFRDKNAIPEEVTINFFGKKETLKVDVYGVSKIEGPIDAGQIKYICGELPTLMSVVEDRIREFAEANYAEFMNSFYGDEFGIEAPESVGEAVKLMEPTGIFFSKPDVAEIVVFPNMDSECNKSLKVSVNLQREVSVEIEDC